MVVQAPFVCLRGDPNKSSASFQVPGNNAKCFAFAERKEKHPCDRYACTCAKQCVTSLFDIAGSVASGGIAHAYSCQCVISSLELVQQC